MKSKHIILHAQTKSFAEDNFDLKDLQNKQNIWNNNLGENTLNAASKGFSFDIAAAIGSNSIPTAPAISVEDITEKEAMDIKNDPLVADVFQSMPLALIEPVLQRVNINAAGAKYTWGIEAVNAHNSGLSGRGVKVAVLDTGIDVNHPAFSGVNISAINYTKEVNEDINGHGTHCAGTIFGRDVDGIRIGVASGVEDVFIGKVLGKGGGDVSSLVTAIDDAVKFGANIISMSLGIDFPGYVERRIAELAGKQKPRVIISEALNVYRKNVSLLEKNITALRAYASPVLIIAAAGNESNGPIFKISVSAPAVSDGFISVGALGRSLDTLIVANFSNSEPMLSGPGIDVISARLGGGLISMDGTSMATPHVAGVAALWAEQLKKQGQFNYNMFNARLLASCNTSRLPVGMQVDYGAGIVQAP